MAKPAKSEALYRSEKAAIKLAGGLFRLMLVVGVCYLLIFPLLYLIVSAVQEPESMKDATVVWVPKVLSTQSFANAISELNYGKSFLFSLFLSAAATLLTLISCSAVGYGFARFQFAEKKIAFFLVILLIIVPPQTTMMSTYLNFRFFDIGGILAALGIGPINMIDSPVTILLPAMLASGIRAGLSIFIFRQFFLGQPKELEEAAKIDGAGQFIEADVRHHSRFGTYAKIMMPLSAPAIITVSVFTFVWYWNDSFYSEMFFTGELKPLAAGLASLREAFLADVTNSNFTAQEQRGILAAASLLCVIPPLILYGIVQRKFAESIERTGIVG